MNELFKKDITIKIGSVLIGMLFWLYVLNLSNPFETKTFSKVPLKIENEDFITDNGYILKNKYMTNIDITVRGRQEVVEKMRESDFDATLDFSQIKSVNDKTLKIKGPFCSIKDVVIEPFSPNTIDIQLARTKNNTFAVEPVFNITLKPGYKIIKTTVDPESIPIIAEESIINSVDSIKAGLDIKNLDRDVTKNVDCTVFNKDGKKIADLSKNLKIEVKIEVAKEVPVIPVIKGKPAPDFVVTQQTVAPDSVLITGAPEVLAKITDLKTEPVVIDNIKDNYSVTAPVKLPDNIKLADMSKDVAVSITVEQLISRDIILTSNDIKLLNMVTDGSMNYEIKTESVTIQLKGKLADIDGLDAVSITPSVNVAGLVEGMHKVPVNIILPTQVKLMQDAAVDVKVSKVVGDAVN